MKAKIEDIKLMAGKIKHSGHLCNFTGKCESEVMVAQTIHAAVNNYEEHGEAFSVKDINKGHNDNYSAYRELVEDQLFIEEKRHRKTVIFPSQLLIDKLKVHFTEQEVAKIRR